MAERKSTATIDLGGSSSTCRMCGTAYGKLNGFFYKSNQQLYKGIGYLPICKRCVDLLFENYLAESGSAKDSVEQICRKLDLYWDESLCNSALKSDSARNVASTYISRLNAFKFAGKSYDDYLREAGTLWEFADTREAELKRLQQEKQDRIEAEIRALEEEAEAEAAAKAAEEEANPPEPVPDEVKDMWGAGYSDDMYRELEQRRQYWMVQLAKDGVDLSQTSTQALLRQIVATELEINRGRTAGSDVDKKINTLNSLLGSAALKPSQQKAGDDEDTPLGVWTWKYEHERPLPDIDEKLKDKNGIRKYITIWLKGHLAKMVGLKNSYSQMYEDEIKRLTVDKIEYDDDTDDSFLADLFSYDGGDDP